MADPIEVLAGGGGTIVAAWANFSGNCNVEVWKGGVRWTYANITAPGTGSPSW